LGWTATLLQNRTSVLRELWVRLGSEVRSSWTSLLADDLLRDFYLSLYNDAADPTRRPVATSGDSQLNQLASRTHPVDQLLSLHKL